MHGILGQSQKGNIRLLVLVCFAWKILLLILAAFCPGAGYDTSALISLDASTRRHENFRTLSRPDHLILNLFRWDALYFVKAAERDKLHEQEWAFSWAYSHLLRVTGQYVFGTSECSLQCYIVAGIVISNICHLLSVLVLYHLVTLILQRPDRHQIAFVAAVLHVLTPASLFLSAPYAEALFSLLNFAGMVTYTWSKTAARAASPSFREDACKLSSGLLFALASSIRSNGLLSGLIFLYDVAGYLPRLVSAQPSFQDGRRIIVTCIAGSLVALGYVGPQYIAYNEFCGSKNATSSRPWCERTLPSIYTWVQSHYWNVGFFRYWTIPNLPLFLMAAPMLWILVQSSVTVLFPCLQQPVHGQRVSQESGTRGPKDEALVAYKIPELALPQLVLALTALTSFHVQIVNRIASGYPTWYVVLGTWIVDTKTTHSDDKVWRHNQWFVRGMMMYALIQGMLFANFLPPA